MPFVWRFRASKPPSPMEQQGFEWWIAGANPPYIHPTYGLRRTWWGSLPHPNLRPFLTTMFYITTNGA